jgi:hypothetical protein
MCLIAEFDRLDARKQAYNAMVRARAKRAWEKAFGPIDSGIFFLYAHNWQDLPHLSREQRHTCRYVNWLGNDVQWRASRLIDAWYQRRAELLRAETR